MLITLTTDFGLRDSFVGVMKGVIASINPLVQVIDITHGVPAQDVLAGALVLRHAVAHFPPDTIHVAVVDPGVGSSRRPILIATEDRYLIGPDNGLLSLALSGSRLGQIVELSASAYRLRSAGTTFDGRDIFAPAAAHLSVGVAPAAFGQKLNSFCELAVPPVRRGENTLEGEIIYIDGFGNLLTNIEEQDMRRSSARDCEISVGVARIRGLSSSYAAASAGEFVAVINSWGVLEIAVNRGNAQQSGGAGIGDKVKVMFAS
jgi:S-adenosylmethionine hydrolase